MTAQRGIWVVLTVLAVAGCAPTPPAPLADDSNRAVQAAIDDVTQFPTELDPRLWSGQDLKPEIGAMSLKIVDRIVATSAIPGLAVDAVELFGSNASYEYDDASDFGIHVFTHSDSLAPQALKGLLKLLNDDIERRQEGDITFYGIPVEVTFHGERSENYRPTKGIGQYSLSEGRWIEPAVQQPSNFDRTQMATELKSFISKYNDLVSSFVDDKKQFDCARFGELDSEMGAYRNTSFTKGLGSRSTPNLVYRALRRMNVNIPSMLDSLEDECINVQESIG